MWRTHGGKRLVAMALLGVTLAVSSCSTPTSVAATAAMATQDTPEYTFEYPQGWVRQLQGFGVGEQFTMSAAKYSGFSFTLFKKPTPTGGLKLSLAQLCELQDDLRTNVAPTGAFEKKEFWIDGSLCCYGIFKELDQEVHVLSTVVDDQLYVFLYQFTYKALFDDTKERVTADMARLFQSWRWKKTEATPAPAPSAEPSEKPLFEFLDYFPVAEGMRWTYQVLEDDESRGSLVVTAKTVAEDGERAGTTTVSLEKRWVLSGALPGRSGVQSEVYEKNFYGLHLRDGDGRLSHLRQPLVAGQDWEEDGHRFVVQALSETVATPLGPLWGAIKIVETRPDGATVARWYTVELGLVQEVETTADGKRVTISLADHEAP